MKHLNFLLKTRWLLVPLMLLTLGVGQVWGTDVTTPVNGSNYRFKATLNSTDYYLVAPTSTGIGTVSTSQSEGTIFTFTKESNNWYITFVSGTTTYYMYESGSNGQVTISTTKTKVTTVTTNTTGGKTYAKIGGSKWIQFNGGANPKRMGCYSSAQTGVVLEEVTGSGQQDVSLTSLDLNPASVYLAKGGSVTLSPVYTPDNATNKNVTWSSSNTSVANVTSAGVVTASSTNTGTATITCTSTQSSSIKATCTVTVANGDVLTASNLNYSSYTSWTNKKGTGNVAVYAGESTGGGTKIQLRATNPSGIVSTTSAGKIKNVSVVWDSGSTNTSRTVDIYGKNSAYSTGADLYSNSSSTQGTKIGSIAYPATTCTLSSTDYEYVGIRSNTGALYLTSITFFWEAIPTHTLTYGMAEGCGSMGSLSATVGGNTVTSGSQVNEGASVTLVPTINSGYEFVSYAATAGSTITNNVFTMPTSNETVTLTLQAKALTALSLNKSSLDLQVNESEQLSVTSVTPNDALTTVTWSTSDGTVAIVTDGLVEAKKGGTATITATSTVTNSVKATCTVTVTEPVGVADPTLTLADDVSHNAGSVVKVNNYNNDYIYAYTLDGTTTPALDVNLDPVENVSVYDHTDGITLSTTCTLKIVAYDIDGNHSDVVTKNYTINPAATVKLYENTQLKTTLSENLFVGTQIATRPNPVSATLGGKTFVGWCASTADPTSLIVFPYTITGTETVWHAVYATLGNPTFTKLSSNSFDSQKTYVLGAEQSATDNTLWFKSTTYTVNENESWGNAVQASASNIAFFTLSGTASALVAQDAAGNYIVAPTANKNFKMSSTEGTLALQNDGTIQAGETYYVRYNYNNNAGGFRSYTSETAQPAYFYEYTAGSISGHITSVTSHAITEATCDNGEVEADASSAPVATTITITASGSSAAYDLLAFDVYKTADPSVKVNVTVDENDNTVATFTMPDYPVTVSASFVKVGTAEAPLTVAELIASQADLAGHYVYAEGIISQLGSFSSYNGYYTYYFSADGTTINQFQVYHGYKGSYQENETWYYSEFTDDSDLAVGDEVIVEGTIEVQNSTDYRFKEEESELTYHCRPVVVTKGAESNGTFTITANEESITTNKKYCLADLSGATDLMVTVEAEPAAGYRLKSITSLDGETEVGTVGAISNNSCTITGIKASTTITANFEQVFAVTLAVANTGTLHGDCSATINDGAGPVSVAAGETINLVASVASADDEFVNWTATEGITIANATALSTTATTTQAGTITANFRPLADPHTITNGGVNAAYGTIVMKDMEDKVVTSLSLRPDKTGKLVAEEEDGYRFTGWTVTPVDAVTFTDASAMETTFAAKDEDATISATYEARTAFTVKFMNGNTQIGDDATVYDGRTIDLLGIQTSFDPNHTVFCGWVKNSFAGLANVEPSFVSGAQTIDGSTTFYAVYGNANETNNYGKITEAAELESGKNYLIVAEYNSGLEALHAAELNKEYWLKTGVVTADNNVIASTVAERTWQISVNAGVAHVYNAGNEKYLGVNYVSSGDYYNARIFDDAYDLTIAPNDGAWNISGVSNTKTVYVIHAPGYSEYIGSSAAAPVYLYKQLYESDEWVSLPVEYVNVTFDKNAGSETVTNMPANITGQMKGYSLTAPSETPERAGYNFIGWNTNNEATEQMSFPQTINTNTTVYAIWQAYPDCAIDLYVNGVKDDDISTSVKQGAELDLSAIDAPERLGYDFLGWAANPRAEENTTAIATIDAYTPTPNVDTQKSFYAVYTRQEGVARYEKVTSAPSDWSGVYLIVNEDDAKAWKGSSTNDNAAIDITILEGTIAASDIVNAETFTFASMTGGYSIQGASGKYIYGTSGNNVTNYGTDPALNTISISSEDVTITSNTSVLRQNNGTASMFRYYKSSSYSSQHTIQLYKYVAPTTYYTTNPAVKYSVSYELGDGAWRTGEGCDEEIVAKGGSYDICTDVPVLTDNIFTGWTIGGDAVTEATITITGTTEIVANYRPADPYTLNYDANGAIGTAPAATNVKEGAEYTVLANSWFFKSGYTFTGWNTAADGSGAAYAKDEVLVMPSENTTLYAQWVSAASDRNVVIVNQYGDKYYAMGQTLNNNNKQMNAVEVNLVQNKVEGVAAENRAAITWRMITNNDNTVSFYNANNSKYLGYSGNDLAYSDDAVNWTWDDEKKYYKIGENGTRTFWYRNSDNNSTYQCFKFYSTGNVGGNGYASRLIIADGFMNTISANDADDDDVALGDDVFVKEGATLTLNDSKPLGDVIVENGGTLNVEATLNVNNFTISTTVGAISDEFGDAEGTSPKVTGVTNIHPTGDVFIEIELTQASAASAGWYAFSVPFEVDALNGVYYQGTKLQNEVGYAIMKYHEDIRSTGAYAWKKYRGIMQPGELYIITVGHINYKTLRFKKHGDAAFTTSTSVAVSKTNASGEGTSLDEGWNGLGNPNLQVSYTTAESYIHFLDHEENAFKTRQASKVNLVVGSAFFIQYSGSGTSIDLTVGSQSGDGTVLLAPKRDRKAVEEVIHEVKIINAATDREEDNVFFTAREDATNSYEIGKDVAKMSMGTAKCAQMSIPAYGTSLCAADFPLVNDKADYPLNITAPAAGTYRLEAAKDYADAILYLTENGRIIWNLSMSAYELDLQKGQNSDYGLRLVAAPKVATGVEEEPTSDSSLKGRATKVIIDEHVFILRGGEMYDVTGKAVK